MYLMRGLDNLLHFSLEKADSFFLSSYCLPVVFLLEMRPFEVFSHPCCHVSWWPEWQVTPKSAVMAHISWSSQLLPNWMQVLLL